MLRKVVVGFLVSVLCGVLVSATPAFAASTVPEGYTTLWTISTQMFSTQFTEDTLFGDGSIPLPFTVTAPKILRAPDGVPLIPSQYFVSMGGSVSVTHDETVEICLPSSDNLSATIVIVQSDADWAIVNGRIAHLGALVGMAGNTVYVPATLFNEIPGMGADWFTPLNGNTPGGRIVLWRTQG